MNIENALRGLKSRIELTELSCYDTIPGSVVAPCAVLLVGGGQFDTFGGADTACELRVLVLVPMQEMADAQRRLFAYMAAGGTKSIRAAVDASPTLPYESAGTVSSASVSGWEAPAPVTIGGAEYLGCEFTVTAYG